MGIIQTILPWIQITLSVILIVSVLLQQNAAGMGGALGGDSAVTRTTRRGFDKFLFVLTIIVALLFGVSAFIALVL